LQHLSFTSLKMWLISILPLLVFSLSWAQLLVASLNVLSVPIALTILPQETSDTTTQVTQTPTEPQQTPDQSVIVTNQIQTTVSDSSTVVVTNTHSYPILPSITSGATTLTINSNTYTISIVDGQTSIYGGQNANDTSAISMSVIGDKTVIVDSPQTTTVFGTSILTTTAAGPTGVATAAGNGNMVHKTGELGVGVGVGIGVGLMALLIIVGLIVAFCMRKRKRQQQSVYKSKHMSATSMEAATFDDDISSTKTRSESGAAEKLELDGTSVNIVQREPVELMGDLPRLLEMAGSQPEVEEQGATHEQHGPRRPIQNNAERETRLEIETQRTDEPPSPLVGSFSRRATQSSIVSPVERSNSERESMWPLTTVRVNGDRVV
jgi:hypothetical protein